MSSEKTEQPTPHKIRKAREDGQVAKSKDFTQVLLLGAMLGYTLANSGAIVRDILQILLFPTQLYGMDFRAAVSSAISELTKSGVMLLVPYLLLGLVVGIFGETIQTGILFAFKALIPKGSKLNPASNLKQMFSMKNVVEFIKSSLKAIFLSAVVYVVIRGLLDPLLKLPYQGIDEAGFMLGEMLKKLVIYTFIGFGAIALLDLVYQRKRYTKDLMMSMQETKQEYKQLEGDQAGRGGGGFTAHDGPPAGPGSRAGFSHGEPGLAAQPQRKGSRRRHHARPGKAEQGRGRVRRCPRKIWIAEKSPTKKAATNYH